MLSHVLKARIKVLAQSAAADVDKALEVYLLPEECRCATCSEEVVRYATMAFKAQLEGDLRGIRV